MKCHKIRELIPEFLEGHLDPRENKEMLKHLKICEHCTKEKMLLEETWRLIGEWQDIEPEPYFKTRFWNRLVTEKTEVQAPSINIFGLAKRWSVALATATIIIIAVSFILPRYFQTKSTEMLISKMDDEEIALVENIDLLENLDIIEDIEFFQDLELIENLDKFDLDKA
ncbi:MAG: zf-HC2 domain-containing protein [Candidatus Omnitrophica bacterium]|nr:zf-HC2 domain-containing protein [Candidatus Omnitrophota bacterium]